MVPDPEIPTKQLNSYFSCAGKVVDSEEVLTAGADAAGRIQAGGIPPIQHCNLRPSNNHEYSRGSQPTTVPPLSWPEKNNNHSVEVHQFY